MLQYSSTASTAVNTCQAFVVRSNCSNKKCKPLTSTLIGHVGLTNKNVKKNEAFFSKSTPGVFFQNVLFLTHMNHNK